VPDPVPSLRAILEENGELLVRQEDGRLLDRFGQLYFDFGNAQQRPTTGVLRSQVTAEEWYRYGYQAETEERFDDAVKAYRQALLVGGPDAEVCYGLARVLFLRGKTEPAAERFRQTVETDPMHAKGWNSLGMVLEQLGEAEEAVAAYRMALKAAPAYVEVHWHLADLLEELGRPEEAQPHWRAYLQGGTDTEWLRYARERLQDRG
jgi:tetratricopeptide (TPR) repeat protein